jgi:hypothetical protein
VNNKHTFNAGDAAGIQSGYCEHNPGLPACKEKLAVNDTTPIPAGACGN